MRKNENKHRSERKFAKGDWVYLKLQPYRQISVGGMRNQKLSSKFYGPFEILKKIGDVAYQLNLPPNSQIHPVFHVSQLKKKLGHSQVPSPTLPVNGPCLKGKLEPQLILARRMVKKRNVTQTQLLIQWRDQTPDDATWEHYKEIVQRFPDFIHEDMNLLKGGGSAAEQLQFGGDR